MKKINEASGSFTSFQNRDHMRGLPFYGQKGDFNFVMGRSQFTPGVSIKQLPLTDMSRKGGDPGISEFENNVNLIRQYYKPGDRVRGILVNSQLGKNSDGKIAVGKLNKVDVNRKDKTIKIYITDPGTLESKEIYVDTMERIFESKYRALTFSEYLLS